MPCAIGDDDEMVTVGHRTSLLVGQLMQEPSALSRSRKAFQPDETDALGRPSTIDMSGLRKDVGVHSAAGGIGDQMSAFIAGVEQSP